MEYVYLSLKRTHKNDDWFCFWGPNGAGYTYLFDQAGIYKETYEGDDHYPVSTIAVRNDLVSKYAILIKWENKKVLVVPNCDETRKEFGIDKKDLHAAHKFAPGPYTVIPTKVDLNLGRFDPKPISAPAQKRLIEAFKHAECSVHSKSFETGGYILDYCLRNNIPFKFCYHPEYGGSIEILKHEELISYGK